MSKQLPVHKLTPSAARLWAAALTRKDGETYNEMVRRSGIREWLTYEAAHDLLLDLGFFVMINGQEYAVLTPQDPEATRVTQPVATMWPGTITKVTTAKQ